MDESLLLTVEEAGARLGLKRSKTYELLARGALGSVQIGRCRRVPVVLLERFVRRLIAEQVGDDELTTPPAATQRIGAEEAGALGSRPRAPLQRPPPKNGRKKRE